MTPSPLAKPPLWAHRAVLHPAPCAHSKLQPESFPSCRAQPLWEVLCFKQISLQISSFFFFVLLQKDFICGQGVALLV